MWIIMHHIALISKGCEGYWSQSEDDLLAWIAIGLILSSLLRPYCIHAPSTNREQEHEVANTFAFVTAMFLLPVAESHISAATQSLFADTWVMAQAIPCSLLRTLLCTCDTGVNLHASSHQGGNVAFVKKTEFGSCISLPDPLLVQICCYYAGRRFF